MLQRPLPFSMFRPVTLSDTVDLPKVVNEYPHGLLVNVGGTVSAVTKDDQTVELELVAGQVYDFSLKRIRATGTDGGVALVACWRQ